MANAFAASLGVIDPSLPIPSSVRCQAVRVSSRRSRTSSADA